MSVKILYSKCNMAYKNKKYKIWLDMDGVLVDFVNGYKTLTNGIRFEDIEKIEGKSLAVSKFTSLGSNFWSNLNWIQGGQELYETCQNLFNEVHILSSSGSGDRPAQHSQISFGKLNWLSKNIPKIKQENIIIVNDRTVKQKYASSFGVLIDDHSINIGQWNAKGGIGIHHDSAFHIKTIKTLHSLINE